MVLKLISATPSPYARKVRIALHEKGIPFELQIEVPWDSTTETPKYNPLEKLPVLIDDGFSIYESSLILEYLELHYPPPTHTQIYSTFPDLCILAKQVQVVADGVCDALVLLFWERQRPTSAQSHEWTERQRRKVDGGLKALAEWVGDEEREFIVNERLTVADIAVGSALGYMKVRFPELVWEERYTGLRRYSERLEARESFKLTVPRPQVARDKVV